MSAHRHTAECSHSESRKQRHVRQQGEDAVRIVLPFEDRPVPLSVERLMDEDKHGHAYADPLMQHLACHLIRHQA